VETARVIVERESVNDDFVVVTRVMAADGTLVLKGQPILQVETSKSVSDVEAPSDGRLCLHASPGAELKIGALMFEIGPVGPASAAPELIEKQAAPLERVVDDANATAPAMLSEAARRAARSSGLSESLFAAGGWVTEADVIRLAQRTATIDEALSASDAEFRGAAPGHRQRQSKRKLTEIRNLAIGNAHGCTSTIGVSVVASGRRLVKPSAILRDTIADLVIFEGTRLLHRYPRLNACWTDDRHVALYEHVNFGVSFDSGDNLKVLAIQRADTLNLIDIQNEFCRLLDLYETGGPISDDLLASATVTLSDLCALPVSFMQPLVNGRQSLILGLTRPTAGHYEIFAGFDHRVAEGLVVARFLQGLRDRVASYFGDSVDHTELHCSACSKSMQEELELGGRGFLNVILGNGSRGLLCRNCFAGY
jgi:pyruvate/2-oxoglutarate dehydrogenase complex dihydrolipoamide acyltransferase (E2) component